MRLRGELPYGDKQLEFSKEQVYKVWEDTLAIVPDDFNFAIKTYNDG